MSENNTAPQQGRLPQVTPAIFEAINQLDGYIQKAPLTRTDHQTAFQHLQSVLRHVETLEAQNAQLTIAVSQAKTPPEPPSELERADPAPTKPGRPTRG